MSIDPVFVALVGRPNVGKSRLFNRLVGRRVSIVHDEPGVTRDIVSQTLPGGISLLDTGGLGREDQEKDTELLEATQQQVHFALTTASLILFVVDGRSGLAAGDLEVAKTLRKAGKEVFLVINKLDHDTDNYAENEFAKLGFKEVFGVSAEHGRGTDQLWEKVRETVGQDISEDSQEEEKPRIKLCFAGRPNVGKSSLANSLLHSDRLIVSDTPGTTRDAVEYALDYTNKHGDEWFFTLIDTAGLRKKNRVSSSVEYFSTVRSQDALGRADVVYLVLDSEEGVSRQEKALVNTVREAGCGLVVLVNKWDLAKERLASVESEDYESEREFRDAYLEAVTRELFPFWGAPVIFVSAKESWELERMLRAARGVERRQTQKFKTAELNKVIQELFTRQPPAIRGGKRFKVYYAVQTGTKPLRLRLFCNREEKLDENYRKYLLRGLGEKFDLLGCPVVLEIVGKERRYTTTNK
ncbi:MAG: ribosome biogenesis GTPase Der [Opitutales bacterium]|nr:ribosome biogenesis GTPase Der [Opitutales bacterium]